MKEEKTKSIKFLNLIVFILVLLIVVAFVVGMIQKGKRQQKRLEQYGSAIQEENRINAVE